MAEEASQEASRQAAMRAVQERARQAVQRRNAELQREGIRLLETLEVRQKLSVSVHGGVCCPSAIISETAALSLFILHHQLRVMKLPEQRIHRYNLRFIRITDIE